MPTLGTLAAGIKSVSATRRSEVYITELGDDDLPIVERGVPQYRRFQYFPESIADTKQVSYQTKEVPGGSLPLYQYTGSGERTISFTVYFATDVDHLVAQSSPDFDVPDGGWQGDMRLEVGSALREGSVTGKVEGAQARMRAAGHESRNPYIPGALIWLRRFTLPRYGQNSEVGVPITTPPRKLLLHFTGSNLEALGGSGGFTAVGGGILAIMTQCDINIEALFPSGNIRVASVSLAFAEVAQRGGVVKFPHRGSDLDSLADAWYKLSVSSANSSSGSR